LNAIYNSLIKSITALVCLYILNS